MKTAFQKLSVVTRRVSVVALGLWLSGVGCVFGCTTPAHAQTHSVRHTTRAQSAQTAHCPAHARHAAGAKAESGTAAATLFAPPSESNQEGLRCPKAGLLSDAARKQNPAPERADLPAWVNPTATDFVAHYPDTPDARQRAPDGRSAHVLCCVFLI